MFAFYLRYALFHNANLWKFNIKKKINQKKVSKIFGKNKYKENKY